MRVDVGKRTSARVEFEISWSSGEYSVFVDVPGEVGTEAADDAALAACLLPAMALGEADLELGAPVDARLVEGTGTIQDVVLSWDLSLRARAAKYHRSAVRAATAHRSVDVPDGRGTACFFTGGVDSFHSVVKNRSEIDALVFVHGFDIDLEHTELHERVMTHLGAAADELGLPLYEFRTNLRRFGEVTGVDWPDYHGAALATIGHLLGSQFSRVLIPASWGYAHLEPYGSHPLVDPLWSSDAVEIVHDGAELNRLGKIRVIADAPVARAHLRVCYRNPDLAYNCGQCNKCVRTGVAAEIAGVGDGFVTLPVPQVADVARLRIHDMSNVTWQDYLDDLVRRGTRPDLQRAIATALLRQRITGALPMRNVGHRIAQMVWAARYPRAALARARARLQ